MGFFEKLGEGLRKTRDTIFGTISQMVDAGEITPELYDDLEEQLILADTGADVAAELVDKLKAMFLFLLILILTGVQFALEKKTVFYQ